jgi:hypothetical protein
MPLIYNNDLSVNEETWFPSECVTENGGTEDNGWNLRHVALSVNDWMSENQTVYDWIGGGAGVAPHCEMLLELKHHSGASLTDRQEIVVLPGDAYKAVALRLKTDQLRVEFEALSKKWHRDTVHLSLVSKKVGHPAYLRIVGMGEAAIPLLLEALRDRPTHWFAALRATANTDPSPIDANPSQARDAWLSWGRSQGYIDYHNG